MNPRTHDGSPTLKLQFNTLRKARIEARERFMAGRSAEKQYAIRLRGLANHVGEIIRGVAPDGIVADVSELMAMLNHYADLLHPWANSVAGRMIADVSRRDAAAWIKHGRLIGQSLREEIENAPTGQAMRTSLAEQVQYITSIPREAAERLHTLTIEGISKGTRAREIAAEIMRSGEVSKSSAMRLARTGVSSTATLLTKARAEHIGSEGYIWRTSRDADVRKSHREMEGKFVPWKSPPTLDGFTAHVGQFANCRCFPEPQIPERFGRASA
jgi:SPP1 gp7 family putative phage head morphogenesis protein